MTLDKQFNVILNEIMVSLATATIQVVGEPRAQLQSI